MTRCSTAIAIGVVSAAAVVSTTAEAQRRPDFTGEWVLVEALAAGPGRVSSGSGSGAPAEARPTTSTTISGAPFNCGRGCTIAHKGEALTIARAELADDPGRDTSKPTPTVTLPLNGRTADVIDTFSPSRQLPVQARWERDALRLESQTPGRAVIQIQVLSLERGQLRVVSSSAINGETLGQTTFTYRRK